MSDTNWLPELSDEGPRYRALADAIANAVADGRLRPGDRLPPVRDLAWRLQVTPGTVSRAYQLAEHRGVLEGQVGRGTFVRGASADPPRGSPIALERTPKEAFDFRANRAPDIGQNVEITAALERLMARRRPLPLTDYHRYGEDDAERGAGVEWLRAGGIPARLEDMVMCLGAQQGILTALAATASGGDAIALTEPLIHPGLKDCARVLGLRLEPVEMDADGVSPDALDAACARWRPGVLILTANQQNPTQTTMPIERREAIADIARRRRIAIIEDDVYGWVAPERIPSFPCIAPELTWYVTSLSKSVAAGLRAGYILAPTGEGRRAARMLQGHTEHISWLVSALAAEVILSGDAARIVEKVRDETVARSTMLGQVFGEAIRTAPYSTLGWLTLPEPWRASDFVVALEARDVFAPPAEVFAVGRAPAPHAIRVAVGNMAQRDDVAADWSGSPRRCGKTRRRRRTWRRAERPNRRTGA